MYQLLFWIFFTAIVFNPNPSFATPGSGTQFLMTKGTDRNELNIYFLKSPDDKTIMFEVNLKSLTDSESLQISMDQHFQMKKVGGTFQITKGVIKIPQMDKPQILPAHTLSGANGVQMKSFLLGSMDEIDGLKIGPEKIKAGAKTFSTIHYQKVENGQTVDFWVSDEAKPIGLVKMISKGSNADMNYELLYQKPLSGMKQKIDPTKAVPLDSTSELLLDFLLPKK